MKFVALFCMFMSLQAISGIDPLVLIRGTATGSFNDKEIQVKDTFGQKYYLPKTVFPKGFVPEAGKVFTVEVHEKYLKNLKVEQPPKKK